MKTLYWMSLALAGVLVLGQAPLPARAADAPQSLAQRFAQEVGMRLEVPPEEVARYAAMAEAAAREAGITLGQTHLLIVDRDPQVQALLLMWRSAQGEYRWLGASPVSTGRPGSFDHFVTPVGVFEHSLANPDFRAEGTFNANGIRGYGIKGMRVYDFGWQQARKGWGDRSKGQMRLQLHATDPALLEPRLGTAQSKGCIRVPASLNRFLDRHGVLDAAYDQAAREGRRHWVLRPDREPVADAGRYMIVVDSGRVSRPQWSPVPGVRRGKASAAQEAGVGAHC